MAIIGRPFVLPDLSVYHFHLLLETNLLHKHLHSLVIICFAMGVEMVGVAAQAAGLVFL
jgi:hypothetical protein